MKDYTEKGEIVRGGRWPSANGTSAVLLTNSEGWPDGSDGWTWQLILSQNIRGGTPDLSLTSASAAIVEGKMLLTFFATATQTAALPGISKQIFNVELKSINGDDVNYYDPLQGTANVRDPVGEA